MATSVDIEFNPKSNSSPSVTTRTGESFGDFRVGDRSSAPWTGWLRRISRRYLVVKWNLSRSSQKTQFDQGTADINEFHCE